MLNIGSIAFVRFNQLDADDDAVCIILDPAARTHSGISPRVGMCVNVLHPTLGSVTMFVVEMPDRGAIPELEEV